MEKHSSHFHGWRATRWSIGLLVFMFLTIPFAIHFRSQVFRHVEGVNVHIISDSTIVISSRDDQSTLEVKHDVHFKYKLPGKNMGGWYEKHKVYNESSKLDIREYNKLKYNHVLYANRTWASVLYGCLWIGLFFFAFVMLTVMVCDYLYHNTSQYNEIINWKMDKIFRLLKFTGHDTGNETEIREKVVKEHKKRFEYNHRIGVPDVLDLYKEILRIIKSTQKKTKNL